MDVDYALLNPAFHHDYKAFFAGELNGARLAVVFLAEFFDKNIYAVDVIMKKKPRVIYHLGYTSITCTGGYAMPVWQHLSTTGEIHIHQFRLALFRQTMLLDVVGRTGRNPARQAALAQEDIRLLFDDKPCVLEKVLGIGRLVDGLDDVLDSFSGVRVPTKTGFLT